MLKTFLSSLLFKHSLKFFLALLICSCTKRHKSPSNTLIIGIANEVKNLDVRFTRDKNAYKIIQLLSQPLLDFDEKAKLVPELVQSFRKSSDSKKLFFKLKKDSFFYTGEAVLPSDVIFSFKDANRPGAPLKKWLDEVERYYFDSIKNEFIIELKQASPFFLSRVIPLIKILPQKHAQKKDFFKNPIGSGPYYLDQKRGRDIILLRNEHYRPKATYQKIIFRQVSDSSSRLMAIMANEIDLLIGSLSFQKIVALKKSPKIQVMQKAGHALEYIGFNLKHPILQKRSHRHFLSSLINKKQILQYKFLNFAQIAQTLFPSQHAYFLPPTSLRTEQTQSPLQLSGKIELLCSSDKESISWLLLVKKAWEESGLDVEIKSYEFATFYSMLKKGDYDAFSFKLNTKKDPGFLFDMFHSSQFPPGKNRFYHQSEKTDSLLKKITSNISDTERLFFTNKLQKQLFHEKILLPLWHKDQVMILSSRVKNFSWKNNWREVIFSHKTP